MNGGKKNTVIKIMLAKVTFLIITLGLTFHQGMSQTKFNDNPVVAHRGAWKKKHLPENSIAALKEAIRLKCLGSEFDVRMTSDDSLIVNHDPHFHGLDIEKSTFDQLSKFPLSNGEVLPTLTQYLLAGINNNPGTILVIELKPSPGGRGRQLAYDAVAIVKSLNIQNRVMYISFDINILSAILEKDPEAETQYLNGDQTPDQLKTMGIKGLDYHHTVFKKNQEWIEHAKKNGQKLNVWTVNEEADLKWFIGHQFDAITTNEPELLFEILNRKR